MRKERILKTINAIAEMKVSNKDLLKVECLLNGMLVEILKPNKAELVKMKNSPNGLKLFSEYIYSITKPNTLNVVVEKALWDYFRGSYYPNRSRTNLELYKELNKDYRCIFCNSKENLEVDHTIPIAIGGKDAVENYNIICSDCNKIKGKRIAGIEIFTH